MYFTSGEDLQFEEMMKNVPPGIHLATLSSTNLSLGYIENSGYSDVRTKKEGLENECGQ